MARFKVHVPITTFEKADAPAGEQRRIGGVISTEARDADGEIILQDGLNFAPFLNSGWFNENHDPKPQSVLGYPAQITKYEAGATLPNGEVARTRSTWAEGFLIPGYAPADRIWELSQALQKNKMKRSLAYSIEGSVTKRDQRDRKLVLAADVDHVAITHCPKNPESFLVALQKAVVSDSGVVGSPIPDLISGGRAQGMSPDQFDPHQLEIGAQHELEHTTDIEVAREIAMDHLIEDPAYYTKLAELEAKKALTVGGDPHAASPQPGDGSAYRRESLARKADDEVLSRAEAIFETLNYFPSATPEMAAEIVDWIALGALGRN